MRALGKLLWADLRHHGSRLFVVGLGLSVAAALFVLLCALGLGVREGLLKQWGEALPRHMVEVKPQGVVVGPLELNLGGLVGDGPLTLDQVGDLRALPHVRAAYAVLDVPLPMAATGGAALFGKSLNTQIFASGLPTELVGEHFMDDPNGPIPVVLHESLVTLYNTTVAAALHTPRITSQALVGLGFTLAVGQSPLMAQSSPGPVRRFAARIVGTSPFALPLGVSMPTGSAIRLMNAYGAGYSANPPLRSVLLEADGPEALRGLGAEVEALGLHVDDRAAQVGQMLQAMVVVMALVGALALALSGVGMVYAFGAYVSARRRELTLLRLVGTSQGFVLTLMLTQAVVLGAAAGALGLLGAALAMQLIERIWGPSLSQVPLLPETLFVLPPTLMAAAMALTVTTAVLGALPPALAASLAKLTGATHGP